jgi:hypothetical protein
MATYRCRDHGVELTVWGEDSEHRQVRMPPPVTPANRGDPNAGIQAGCVLLVMRYPEAGEIPRRSHDGRPLQGVCHVEEVG